MNEFNPNNLDSQFDFELIAPKQEPKVVRDFSILESVFAWLSFVVGYLFCRAFPVGETPLGGFLFIVFIFVATFILLKIKGCTFRPLPIILALSAVAMSASLIISNNSFIYFFAYSYSLAVYCYFIYAVAGEPIKSGFNDCIIMDFFKAIFVTPFFAFSQLFKGMFSGRSKRGEKVFSKILLGLALAVIPTAIVLGLLSYDDSFSNLMEKIFGFTDIGSQIVSLIFAIPIGMYVFGLFISSSDKICKNLITQQECENAYRNVKIAPTVTIMVAAIPLLLVYVVFFISQFDYYISGFTGVLPSDLSYAQYAREGFFQLCIVSVINLLVILLALVFTKRKAEQPSSPLKILTIIYSVFTLILISTAVAKMIMYINYYGLTQKRVYATWFMFLLALLFIIIVIKQFVPKFKALAVSLILCVVLFAGLSLSNIDGHIVSYNVDRYLDGSLQDFDVQGNLVIGDAAIPELARLYKELDAKKSELNNMQRVDYESLKRELTSKVEKIKKDKGGIFSFSVPSERAENALREIGFLE